MTPHELILGYRRLVYSKVVRWRGIQGTLWSDDDIAHTVFVSILRRPPKKELPDNDSRFSWVKDRTMGILFNLLAATKTLKRRRMVQGDYEALQQAKARATEDIDIRADVESMLEELGPPQATIVRMYWGINTEPVGHIQNIAKMLHMSQPRCRDLFLQALRRMKVMLGGDDTPITKLPGSEAVHCRPRA